jgi:hypothetical protein
MYSLMNKKYGEVCEFVADTDSDVQNLPTNVGVGSTCIVVGDGSGAIAYMLNNNKEWVQV